MAQHHIQEHIELIARHEQEFLAQRRPVERLADSIASFAGSFPFVLVHIAIFVLWIVVNGWRISGIHHFDPFPYPLLGTIVAAEALLLASFILMRQIRMGRRSDERDHLMLQILLLTEKEVTALLAMNRQMAGEMGLDKAANSPEARELSRKTSIEDVTQTIRDSMPDSEVF